MPPSTKSQSAFRSFWLSAENGRFALHFPERAERPVCPVAELAEMWKGRLVRDATSHRGGPAADLISSSWLQRREDADLITARLSPSCGALSRVRGSVFSPLRSTAAFYRAQSERSKWMCTLLMWVLIRGQRPDLALSPEGWVNETVMSQRHCLTPTPCSSGLSHNRPLAFLPP